MYLTQRDQQTKSTVFSVSVMTTTGLSRSIYGPLTTVFTAPSSCGLPMSSFDGSRAQWWRGVACVVEQDNAFLMNNPSCWPPANGEFLIDSPYLQPPLYSPGLSCPSGYWTACNATATISSDQRFYYPPVGPETAAGCCPEGYHCLEGGNDNSSPRQACSSQVDEGATFVAGTCDGEATSTATLLTVPVVEVVSPSGAATTTSTDPVVYAPMIQLLWQASDTATSTTSTSTPSPGSMATNGIGSAGASGGGLSAADAAGIGVGGTAVILLAICLGIWAVLRRRRRQHHRASAAAAAGGRPLILEEEDLHHRQASGGDESGLKVELPADNRHPKLQEFQAEENPQELASFGTLDGGHGGESGAPSPWELARPLFELEG